MGTAHNARCDRCDKRHAEARKTIKGALDDIATRWGYIGDSGLTQAAALVAREIVGKRRPLLSLAALHAVTAGTKCPHERRLVDDVSIIISRELA